MVLFGLLLLQMFVAGLWLVCRNPHEERVRPRRHTKKHHKII